MSRHQLRYAIHGIALGLIASAVVISGTIMIARLSDGRQIGHGVPLGFVLFTAIFVLIVYRIRRGYRPRRRTASSTRFVTPDAVTELPNEYRLQDQSSPEDHQTRSA
jgi:hypothetical protein